MQSVVMPSTVEIPVPDTLLLHSKDHAALEQRSRLLLALKFFELGEISSGQAAEMCGLSRVGFLFEAGKHGVPVAELLEDELSAEFDTPNKFPLRCLNLAPDPQQIRHLVPNMLTPNMFDQ